MEKGHSGHTPPAPPTHPPMHVHLIFNHLCGSIDNSWPRSTAPKGQFTQLKITSDTDEHFSELAAEFGFHISALGELRRRVQLRPLSLESSVLGNWTGAESHGRFEGFRRDADSSTQEKNTQPGHTRSLPRQADCWSMSSSTASNPPEAS